MAFGTGEHPTTRLCLAHLQTLASEGALSGARLMDYGAGSGVLAIAALLMGAGAADGTDTDILAVRVAGRNAALNGVAERGRFVQCGPSSTDDAPFSGEMYDVVVANILKGPLMDLR